MTRIRYKHTAKEFRIDFCGHAEYAEGGKDIVCAAISTMASLLSFATDEAEMAGEITQKKEMKPGKVHIRVQYKKAESRVRFLAELIIKALEDLAAQFPENIEIKEQ